jgi:hypothetical protein
VNEKNLLYFRERIKNKKKKIHRDEIFKRFQKYTENLRQIAAKNIYNIFKKKWLMVKKYFFKTFINLLLFN